MKKIKFFATVALLAASLSASAQFTNGGSRTTSPSSSSNDGWSSVWVEWNPSTFKYDVKNADNQSFTGLSVGYSQAFSILPTNPLFLEAGLGLQYSFCKLDTGEYYYYEDDDEEVKFSMFSVKVPVNLIYKFDLPNSTVSLMPHAGVNLRYNLSAKMKYDYDDGYYSDSEDIDLFDKKDMGSDKATWNRFQLGWQIGLKARFGENFLVGVSYGSDFSEIAKKTKIGTTTISLGYAF